MSRTKKLVTVAAEALGPIAAILFAWAVSTHEVALAALVNCLAMGAAAIAEKTIVLRSHAQKGNPDGLSFVLG